MKLKFHDFPIGTNEGPFKYYVIKRAGWVGGFFSNLLVNFVNNKFAITGGLFGDI